MESSNDEQDDSVYSFESLLSMIDNGGFEEKNLDDECEEEPRMVEGYTNAPAIDGRISMDIIEYESSSSENVYYDNINTLEFDSGEEEEGDGEQELSTDMHNQ